MDVKPTARAAQPTDLRTDVCVIGAGIAGISTAYQLSKAGHRVLVVEDSGVAGGETGRTTAHLTHAIDDRIYEIERLHGKDGARAAVESHSAAIDEIEAIQRQQRIDCDFTRLDGYLFLQAGDDAKNLDKELRAARRAGLKDVRKVERAPIQDFDTGPALRFPQQAQFHPLKYIQGLCDAIAKQQGADFLVPAHVMDVKGGKSTRVRLQGGDEIHADATVICTNVPVTTKVVFHTKQSPYRTFAIGVRVDKGSVARNLYWDTLFPYHYVRLQSDPESKKHDILIVGGEDARPGHDEDHDAYWDKLHAWTRQRFPQATEVRYRWSGQFLQTVDGLAYLGKHPTDENVYVITGDSGMGMTHGTIGSLIVRDLIEGQDNEWAAYYDPARKNLRAPVQYVKEAVAMTRKYVRLLGPGDARSVDEIPLGEGAVVAKGIRKVAYYRDAEGRLSACSAICPHLGCVVAWNGAEKSWDCPCHGSRFDPQGHVLNGPANQDLDPIDVKTPRTRSSKTPRRRTRSASVPPARSIAARPSRARRRGPG